MTIYDQKFFRNSFTKKQQEKIRKTTFAIVGIGGTGGFILENLLRMGAENLIIFDYDSFDLSNFNRQLLATDDYLDVPKVHAAIVRAQSINKKVSIKSRDKFYSHSDIENATILMDGADNVKTKIAMAAAAKSKKIPYVFCSANESRGIVSVFAGYNFTKAFQLPKDEKMLEKYSVCASVICPSTALAGTLAASQAINYIIGKPYIKAPEALFFDLFRKDLFWRSKLG